MSFTTGGLLHQDSVTVAKLYFDLGHWAKVREKIFQDNLLQARTLSTSKKMTTVLCSRLKLLSQDELRVLIEGTSQDQAYILWLAVCRRYRFIYEFAVEVFRERFLTLQHKLGQSEYDSFFNAKAEWNEELEHLTDSTKIKLRQVLFRMLREAGLLSSQNVIIPAILSSIVITAIGRDSRKDFCIFPVTEADLKEWAKW